MSIRAQYRESLEESNAKNCQERTIMQGYSKEQMKKIMEIEEEAILKRWSVAMVVGILKDVPEERKKSVAVAMEHQRLLNETIGDHEGLEQFKRISIPMVRRLMDMTELTSHRRDFANVEKTHICLKPSMSDKFRNSVFQYNLNEETAWTDKIVEDVKHEIKQFIKRNDKISMVFLGIALDDQRVLHFYYDWE